VAGGATACVHRRKATAVWTSRVGERCRSRQGLPQCRTGVPRSVRRKVAGLEVAAERRGGGGRRTSVDDMNEAIVAAFGSRGLRERTMMGWGASEIEGSGGRNRGPLGGGLDLVLAWPGRVHGRRRHIPSSARHGSAARIV